MVSNLNIRNTLHHSEKLTNNFCWFLGPNPANFSVKQQIQISLYIIFIYPVNSAAQKFSSHINPEQHQSSAFYLLSEGPKNSVMPVETLTGFSSPSG